METRVPSNIDKEIGERFRQVRRMKDLSQENIANLIGIAQKNYSKLERGESKWTIDRVYEVAEALGLSVVDILPKSKASTGANTAGLPEIWAKLKTKLNAVLGIYVRLQTKLDTLG
ncbi:helix-turn-helix domain-containing protein [Olivibacter sitiensis]|uniref:helix-turn-helix domain-containing protein n=1 Tax=Olivibacter sitiensis TaxID=376470 RepID=UPI00041CFCAA|nr:helix-turn-helix transcriptional regulator [Olivibacter sitiensis]